MSAVFLDSVYLIALEFAHDQHHAAALAHWTKFAASNRSVVTTSFILDEVVTHLNARGHHGRAVKIGQQLLASPRGEFVDIDRALLDAGWSYFVRHDDKRFSLTDCVSFVVMEQRGLRQALTFDRHFVQAGYECLPTSDGA